MRAKLLAIKIELRRLMHDPIAKTGAWVKQMLRGHLNYFAVSGNHPSLWWFFNKVKRLWLASLKRRSQTPRPTHTTPNPPNEEDEIVSPFLSPLPPKKNTPPPLSPPPPPPQTPGGGA